MEKYNFYYDESEHSRKINFKTINANNYYDNFNTIILGWDLLNEDIIEKRYTIFENKYSYRISKNELKSSTLKFKEFKYGFSSINKENLIFIEDFLNIFDENIYIYYSSVSKIEYIIHQLFINYGSNINSIKYSIIKSIILYKPKEIMSAMYNNNSNLIKLLKDFYRSKIIENSKNLNLKKRENKAFSNIILILNEVNNNIIIDWDYRHSFLGFLNYLKEKNIENFELLIDKEGKNQNTLNAAKAFNIRAVKEIDSKNSIGVRIADMLLGIISKFMKSLYIELKYNVSDEYLRRKILNKSWFSLSEKQFNLYKKLGFILLELNNGINKNLKGIYADNIIYLISFLKYISSFKTYMEFKNISQEMHSEYLNTFATKNLERWFQEL